jgi:hypothetical protein
MRPTHVDRSPCHSRICASAQRQLGPQACSVDRSLVHLLLKRRVLLSPRIDSGAQRAHGFPQPRDLCACRRLCALAFGRLFNLRSRCL